MMVAAVTNSAGTTISVASTNHIMSSGDIQLTLAKRDGLRTQKIRVRQSRKFQNDIIELRCGTSPMGQTATWPGRWAAKDGRCGLNHPDAAKHMELDRILRRYEYDK